MGVTAPSGVIGAGLGVLLIWVINIGVDDGRGVIGPCGALTAGIGVIEASCRGVGRPGIGIGVATPTGGKGPVSGTVWFGSGSRRTRSGLGAGVAPGAPG